MNKNLPNSYWSDIEAHLQDARLIAWDTCHKIYLAMDEGQEQWYRDNYAPDIFVGTPEKMLAKLQKWWDESCGLRFISAVWTNDDDQNSGFLSLIPQFADAEV